MLHANMISRYSSVVFEMQNSAFGFVGRMLAACGPILLKHAIATSSDTQRKRGGWKAKGGTIVYKHYMHQESED